MTDSPPTERGLLMSASIVRIVVWASLAAACGNSAPAPAPAPAPTPQAAPVAQAPAAAAPKETAQDVYNTRCVPCHGSQGVGDGVAAAALNPKPRNYTDAEWQKTVTDDQLKKAIVEGGAAVGKSATMPPNPDLAAKPEIVDGLVAIIRGFGAK
jgi:cytochrome c5